MRVAICLGLTHLDEESYGGWDGYCPGCDVDVSEFAKLCNLRGFDGIHVLLNRFADDAYLDYAFVRCCEMLTDDDLLVLYFSGHGGQQPDKDGDEEDGKDETICLWSQELVDDDIAEYLKLIPKGVRVLMITDSCHSGTNYRAIPKSSPIKLTKSPESLRASMLHFGGCSDDRFSYGTEEGGVFTQNLVKVAKRSRRPLSYREWFERTLKLMPKNQVPTIATWGDVAFDDRELLT